jgi:uncharacterized membrane protein YfcA
VHKPLFPLKPLEIAGIATIVFLSMLATSAGVGGGAIMVPLCLMMLKFETKQAVALANGLVFFNGFVKFLMSLQRKHPKIPHRTIIEYNIVIILIPSILLGSVLGSVVSSMLPESVQLLGLIIVLLIALYKGWKKSWKLKKEEDEAMKAEKAGGKGDKTADLERKETPKIEKKGMKPVSGDKTTLASGSLEGSDRTIRTRKFSGNMSLISRRQSITSQHLAQDKEGASSSSSDNSQKSDRNLKTLGNESNLKKSKFFIFKKVDENPEELEKDDVSLEAEIEDEEMNENYDFPQQMKEEAGVAQVNTAEKVRRKSFSNVKKQPRSKFKKKSITSATDKNKISAQRQKQKLREKIMKIEGSNFYPKKIMFILGILLLSLAVTVLRGGKGMESIIGAKKCTTKDWSIFCIYFLLVTLFAIAGSKLVSNEQKLKVEADWQASKYEKNFDKKFVILGNIFGALIGFVSANVGIGGGLMITPLLLSYDFLPQVVSFTGMYLVVANKLVSTTVFLLSGTLPLDYMMFIGMFLVVGVLIVEWKVGKIVKEKGRPSIISFIFVGIVFVGVALVGYSGTLNVMKDKAAGKDIWAFGNFCDS